MGCGAAKLAVESAVIQSSAPLLICDMDLSSRASSYPGASIDDDDVIPSTASQRGSLPSRLTKGPPPLSDDPALIGYDWKVPRSNNYTFQEKSASKRRQDPSFIWQYGTECRAKEYSGTIFWSCNLCWDKRSKDGFPTDTEIHAVSSKGSTSTKRPVNHLKYSHDLDKDGSIEKIEKPRDPRRPNAYEMQLAGARYRPPQAKVDTAREAILRWIIKKRLPLNLVEGDDFASVLYALDGGMKDYITPDGDTIRAWILAEFEIQQAVVKAALQSARSKIHLSFDLWSSPNGLALLGVVAHCLGRDLKAKSVSIALTSVEGAHSGENIAEAVIPILEMYELQGKIGFFMTDNASNNDTCIAALCEHFLPGIDPETRRLRCLGHIINLAVKSFLYGADPEAFESEAASLDLKKIDDKYRRELLILWRRRGPVGKLHNLVLSILVTSQRRQAFEKCQGVDDIKTARKCDTRSY